MSAARAIGALGSLALLGLCSAATIYVDGSAPPGGDGSAGAPFQTIQEGIAAAASGDSVLVLPGVYPEQISTLGKAISVVGRDGADVTTLDGEGTRASCIVVNSGETVATRFEGLTLQNTRGPFVGGAGLAALSASGATFRQMRFIAGNGYFGGGLDADASEVELEDCEFNGCRGAVGGAIYVDNGSSLHVDRCEFTANLGILSTGGIVVGGGSTVSLLNSTFEANQGFAGDVLTEASHVDIVQCAFLGGSWEFASLFFVGTSGSVRACTMTNGESNWAGAMIIDSCDPNVADTVIADSSGALAGAIWNRDGAHPTFTNVTIANNSTPQPANAAVIYNQDPNSVVTIANSILWGNTGGDPILNIGGAATSIMQCDLDFSDSGAGNFSADPLFAGAGDYHLEPDSPCRDAGDNAFVGPGSEIDFDGGPRIVFNTVDVGADEFPCPPTDLDQNGMVDLEDLSTLLAHYGETGNPPLADGNINGDDVIDLADLSLLLVDFGLNCG